MRIIKNINGQTRDLLNHPCINESEPVISQATNQKY